MKKAGVRIQSSIFLAFTIALLWTFESHCAVPQLINYQGRLTTSSGNPVADGLYLIKFQIYDNPTAGTLLWNSGFQSVQVKSGLYTYILGKDVAFPNGLFTGGANRWLGITVGVDPEMTPRKQLMSSAYSLVSQNADSVNWTGIKGIPAGFADGVDNNSGGDITAVNTSGGLTGGATSGDANISIAASGVTSAHIGDGQIVNADINAAAGIATTKISGTAVNLSSAQTITGDKNFNGVIHFSDSSMIVNSDGVSVGSVAYPPQSNILLYGRHNYNNTFFNYGLFSDIENAKAGQLIALYGLSRSSTPGEANGGTVYGVYARAESDGPERYGVRSLARPLSGSVTTGSTYGVSSTAQNGFSVYGVSSTAQNGNSVFGLYAEGDSASLYGYGVNAQAVNSAGYGYGVYGMALNNVVAGYGVYGIAYSNDGIGYGVYGEAGGNDANWAGYFNGDVNVIGTIFTPSKMTRIDHPLDPENKFLIHATVESSELTNLYSGNIVLNANGEADVVLPSWFEAANRDFRYQLTPIGAAMPGLYISAKVSGNRFGVAGGQPGAEVSWQITAVRNDQYSNTYPMTAVKEKRPHERGKYLYPETFGLGKERGIDYEDRKRIEEMNRKHTEANSAGKVSSPSEEK